MSNWIVVGMLALVVPLSFVAAGTSVLPGDVEISRVVQTRLPGIFDPLVVAFNILGKAPVTIAVALLAAGALLLRGHRRPALIVAAAMLAQLANFLLKLTLESPRPTNGLVHVSEQATGFGFPSGHTMGTTVLALVLFHVASSLMAGGLRLRLIQTGLLLTPVMTGIARIETGAHWPSDVVGAWLWGSLAALAIVAIAQRPWSVLSHAATRSARTINRSIAIGDVSGD